MIVLYSFIELARIVLECGTNNDGFVNVKKDFDTFLEWESVCVEGWVIWRWRLLMMLSLIHVGRLGLKWVGWAFLLLLGGWLVFRLLVAGSAAGIGSLWEGRGLFGARHNVVDSQQQNGRLEIQTRVRPQDLGEKGLWSSKMPTSIAVL